jgi:hypothetical protein
MTNEEREKLVFKMHGAYTRKTNRGGFYEREIIAMGAALAIAEAAFADSLKLPPIELDEQDPSREYIHLPGGWEIQTKGRGSSYRLCDTKTGERHNILGTDAAFVRDFVTRMAKEIHAAILASIPEKKDDRN